MYFCLYKRPAGHWDGPIILWVLSCVITKCWETSNIWSWHGLKWHIPHSKCRAKTSHVMVWICFSPHRQSTANPSSSRTHGKQNIWSTLNKISEGFICAMYPPKRFNLKLCYDREQIWILCWKMCCVYNAVMNADIFFNFLLKNVCYFLQ